VNITQFSFLALAFGSSAFGIVITQWVDNQIQVMHAEEYQRPDFNQMLSVIWDLFRRFGKINKIYIDGSNPSFIRACSCSKIQY
jgi:hypothetical protein